MDWNKTLYRILKPVDQFISGKNEGNMLTVGATAPEFSVKNHKNEPVTLAQFRGKKVILWFYPKADTPGCTAEGCGFRDLQADFSKKNAVMLGVSFDTVDENRAFAEKFRFEYPLLCDVKREIGLSYGACKSKDDKSAARIAYVIDEAGKITRAYPKVDAASFPESVLKEI